MDGTAELGARAAPFHLVSFGDSRLGAINITYNGDHPDEIDQVCAPGVLNSCLTFAYDDDGHVHGLLLGRLVDRSLVAVDDDRYRLLETIRAFAATRLADAGEEDDVRVRHLSYVLDRATTAGDAIERTARALPYVAGF